MNGTTTKLVDVTVPFTLDGKEMFIENSDDDVGLDEITKFLTMPLPSFSENNALLPADSNDEFLRLTTTVRAVYFSYLHKCLVSNYILCYKQKDEDMPCNNLKQCADQLELSAVRRSLEASLYRQNMLKLISDIKSHTSKKKVFRNLVIFLETSSNKVDVGVQTSSPWVVDSATSVEDADSLENISDLAGCNETSDNITNVTIKEDAFDPNALDCLVQDSGIDRVTSRKTNSLPSCQRDSINSSSEFHAKDLSQMLLNENAMDEYQAKCINEVRTDDGNALKLQNSSVQLHQEDENSQDSLLQHMEDMFCESDDSSDLTTLIEKHSGVTKANIYNEIRQMCVDTEPLVTSTSCYVPEKINVPKARVTKPQNSSPGKFSFSYYKEMKNRKTDKAATVAVTVDTLESKQKQRSNGIWFVERVHQMSKLKAKMTELSLTNYRKHGRVKEKFVELFGESDIEDMLPDSPICIEEHLTSCKERIAPWIVKCLMPFYKKRRIKDRQLFKAVAKHIADMLIIENTFPEENCVSKYIENYFKNKKFIKTKQDIYL